MRKSYAIFWKDKHGHLVMHYSSYRTKKDAEEVIKEELIRRKYIIKEIYVDNFESKSKAL